MSMTQLLAAVQVIQARVILVSIGVFENGGMLFK